MTPQRAAGGPEGRAQEEVFDPDKFLTLAPSIPVRTEVEVFPLGQANEALARLRAGSVRGAAVLEVGGSPD
jgi:propanol-preferring alcohol dehydrogenase